MLPKLIALFWRAREWLRVRGEDKEAHSNFPHTKKTTQPGSVFQLDITHSVCSSFDRVILVMAIYRPTPFRHWCLFSVPYLDAVDHGVVPRRIVVFIRIDRANLRSGHKLIHDAKVSLLSFLHLLHQFHTCGKGLGTRCLVGQIMTMIIITI